MDLKMSYHYGKRWIFLIFVFFPIAQFADEPHKDFNQKRGSQIILQAREAAVDSNLLAGIKSLSIRAELHPPPSWQVLTRIPQATLMTYSSDLRVDIMLPDRFKETVMTHEGVLARAMAWDQGQAWASDPFPRPSHTKTIRVGEPLDAKNPFLQRNVYCEFVRNLIAFLLTAPTPSAFSYTYLGTQEWQQAKTDIVDVTGPNDLDLQLFFEQRSRKLLFVQYTSSLVPRVIGSSTAGPGYRRPLGPHGIEIKIHPLSRKPREEELEMELSDYRLEGESLLLVPHTIIFRFGSKSGGHPTDVAAWTIREVIINPADLVPEDFRKENVLAKAAAGSGK